MLNAQVSHLSTYAHSHALAGGFVAVAISDSNIDTHSTVKMLIDSNARIVSTRGIDIGAFHRDVKADRFTEAIPIAFIPIPINRGDNNTDLADLIAGRGRRAPADRAARQQRHAAARASTARCRLPPPPASTASYNHLALLVQADDVNIKDARSRTARSSGTPTSRSRPVRAPRSSSTPTATS